MPFGYEATEVTTLDQLNAHLSTADMIATLEPSPYGKVVVRGIAGREADTITVQAPIGETSPTGVRILTNENAPYSVGAVLSEPGASQRQSLARDYAGLLEQISSLARDSGFNGQNLLMGATMRLTFNESGTSSTDVAGAMMDAHGLGLLTSIDGNFLDSQSLQTAVSQLRSASDALRVKASELSSAYNTVGTRSGFTKSMSNILAVGAAALTDGDMNQAAASASALDVRRQMATSSLGLANQAQQAVLQLLRG
ncbi:hypothetical protein BK022_05665 [Methylorubrum extorquens]|uniref:Flagellin C-terminal domain-containing protein n=1 Tax=Methylorubrum extorquens TaxID=408 RepID=A0A1S1P371_METEX|nr:hypothetical protein BK022_05665 [Methylorubrum extorquens]